MYASAAATCTLAVRRGWRCHAGSTRSAFSVASNAASNAVGSLRVALQLDKTQAQVEGSDLSMPYRSRAQRGVVLNHRLLVSPGLG